VPHVVAVRTPNERQVWYKEIAARASKKIAEMSYSKLARVSLVRDDYAGWYEFGSHLARGLEVRGTRDAPPAGRVDLDPQAQQWAGQVQKALRDAAHLVAHAKTTNTSIDQAES